MNHAEGRASAGDGEKPTRLRLPLASVEDVRREMARLYREARAGRLDVADASRLAHILTALSRLIEGAELERRVESLEAAQQRAEGAAWRAH